MSARKANDKQLVEKMERYCAYQERCRQEVRQKVRLLGETDEAVQQQIIAQLEGNKFIDETRYARAFALDKFNLHGWGKVKIGLALRAKGIEEKPIDDALAEINQSAYEQTLKKLLQKKLTALRDEKDAFQKKGKLANYLISKGYETDQVWSLLEKKI
ncbi:MAG: regulatory protein RecX [Chitinophagales bacterium]|nr:regulatory protein RecX [Chitinophagales bacterium]